MNSPPPAPPASDPRATSVPALIEYLGRDSTRATAELVRRSRRERTSRAVLGWAACWGLAIVAIFIPVLHFVLVPALVIAGPLVARSRWRERATVLGVRGPCPGCGAPQQTELRQPAEESMPWRCADCGRPLVLRLEAAVIESDPVPITGSENSA